MVDPERRVEYSEHLKFKLQVRRIPEKVPERIYRQAQERYFDNHTGVTLPFSLSLTIAACA